MEFCDERRPCLSDTYFEHKSLHKYTRMARDKYGVEVKSMIELVLVKRDLLRYMLDVRAVQGKGRGLSDNHVILFEVRFVGLRVER